MGAIPCAFLSGLSTETKLLDNAAVSLYVYLLEIIQELTTLTDEAEKTAARYDVFLVLLHVLGKMSDTVGK